MTPNHLHTDAPRGAALETLFIRIAMPARKVNDTWILESLSWLVLDEAGQVQNQGTGDAKTLAELVGGETRCDPDSVIVVVPGEFCLALQVNVPGRSTGQIRRALPFVVEEYLASDIDLVHIAHGPIVRGAPVDCVAVEREIIRNWCAALATVGVEPGTMLSDAELLPARPDEISLFFDHRRILIRTPQQSLVAESDTLPLALAGAMDQLTGDAPVRVRCINGALTELERARIHQSAPVPLRWEREDMDTTGFSALARCWLDSRGGTNLLQGEFAPQRRESPYWQEWRSVAALAGIWFVVALGAYAGQALWADHRAAQLEREIRAVYRNYFPDDQRASTRPLESVRSQLAQHIGAGSSESGFLALTTVLAESLDPAAGMSLRGLTYNDARLELAVDLNARDFAALDQLRDRLASSGVSVDISSAEQQEEFVRARLRLRG
jgi:general secretion pathway protein L